MESREKIKPEKELQRAKKQILNCKLGIRDTVRQLDLLGSVGKIDDTFISSDGSVHHDHIICKKCRTQEVSEDNDIILCDGTCNCAFHQKCIDPPLATEDIPPEDEGWLCKYCDCKTDLLEAMNAHLGTEFSEYCMWQDIFKEEALLSESGTVDFNPEEEWPDDESDDNDYHPEMDDIYSTRNSDARDNSCSHAESSTSSSNCSLESEAHWESGLSTESNEISSDVPLLHQNCVIDSNDNEIVSGPRQRRAVDYKQLYDEMFAKDISGIDVCSDDEDWDPRKRRRREKLCDAASTLMKLSGSEVKPSDSRSQEVGKDIPSENNPRKRPFKIPYDVLQKLRQTFAENELPSRDVKKDISEAVGIEYAKVNKWFKNARYLALKKRKRQSSLKCPSSDKSDIEVNEDVKGTISECSSPISIHKKQLKKVSWNDNLTTLVSSAKKKRLKKTSPGNTEANVDLSDDMSLKKHLLCLKAKSRQEKGGRPDIEHPPVQSAEMQMEQLWQMEAKLWKLKQVVSTFQKAILRDSIDPSVEEKHVVYVPIAEVKEKL
ncbi:pathogenesis-related homeodomain protein isoform X2 [Silene latifolia]|uniref:pathogenesis-related homeodomain protein isoform X2 n=1 Tax=Silene latifolia TaxID=37657 RepID=UPI003D76E09E